MKNFRTGILAFFLTALQLSAAHAHPLDLGVLKMSNREAVLNISLELNPAAAAKLLGISPDQITNTSVSTQAQELFRATLGGAMISIEGKPCSWQKKISAELSNAQNLIVDASALCGVSQGNLGISLPFLQKMDPTFNLLIRAELNGIEHVSGADPSRRNVEISMVKAAPSFSRFVAMGLEHIGVAPDQWKSRTGQFQLPYGVDHILFIFALILGGAGVFDLLRTVTGFTLGHSISLLLATLGYIQFSGHWIEAAIALTIMFVALTNFLGYSAQHRWKVTIGIGLIHGLGFAAALSQLQLSRIGLVYAVLGFNIGIELGQAVVVLTAFPLVLRLRKTDLGRKYILRGASLCICVVGGFWFFQRSIA